ncbi:MAG TPA: hypothetical protein VFS50_12220 [Meiothermus sp.]|nr:hypothetical protein [Meiothermus sp.]
MKPNHLSALAIALALLLGACSQNTSTIAGYTALRTRGLQAPLAGTVFVPLANGSLDSVPLSGRIHVVASSYPGDPIRIHVNLDQVAGVGSSSGLTYRATGAQQLTLPAVPEDPINLIFRLRAATPPDPVTPTDPILPLNLALRLNFNTDTGTLLGVEVVSITVPQP